MVSFNNFWTKKTLLGLLLGQFLSLLITSTGFSSSELARRGINAPTSQSFANYVLLAIIYGAMLIHRKKGLKAKWYYYILLGIVDVEANYLVVKAYQYTSLTSVMLLDCWTIPCVIFLTWFFLKTKYRLKKFAGVAICITGLVMVIFSDVHAQDRSGKLHSTLFIATATITLVLGLSMDLLILCLDDLPMTCLAFQFTVILAGSSPVKGDFLVIAGSILYAVSNVSEEFLVTNADRVELMAMLGLFGAIISACQISILERRELQSIQWSTGAVLPFIGFALAMFLFYSFVPILLKHNGSTMLNLSLLSSDMWAVLIRIFAYGQKVDWMYFIAFAAVAVGLIIYSWGSKEDDKSKVRVAEDTAEQSNTMDEEAGIGNPDQGSTVGSSKPGDGKYDIGPSALQGIVVANGKKNILNTS